MCFGILAFRQLGSVVGCIPHMACSFWAFLHFPQSLSNVWPDIYIILQLMQYYYIYIYIDAISFGRDVCAFQPTGRLLPFKLTCDLLDFITLSILT